MTDDAPSWSTDLSHYLDQRLAETDRIPADRRDQLVELAAQVATRRRSGGAALTFICTHNSRRSHMAQIWAQTAAWYFGCHGVRTYSGGTEATAFNPSAIDALTRAGFAIEAKPGTANRDNPIWLVQAAPSLPTMECHSKVFDQAPNPQSDFIAVMTCAAADAECPIVDGASTRVSIPYDDPKVADGTPLETLAYDERCEQIAREMLFVFREVASREISSGPSSE